MTTVSGGRATNTVHLTVAVTDTAVIIRTLYGGRAANIYSYLSLTQQLQQYVGEEQLIQYTSH